MISKTVGLPRLNLTASDPPTQAEVQAIANQLDVILSIMQNFP